MKPTLLVLAAGMGSRYGSLKQMDGVGPSGEAIIDYSIYDAIRAGFGKVVFVIRHSFEKDFREVFSPERFGGRIEVDFVFQELDCLPEGFTVPEGREKPWGTNHAVMMGQSVVKDEPFAAINADDFYGQDAFAKMGAYLTSVAGKTGEYAMVGYPIDKTLSDYGSVSRGICGVDADGYLTSIVERTQIERHGDAIEYKDENGDWKPLSTDAPVSMNLFGFTPDYFTHSEVFFKEFLLKNSANLKAEYFIPLMVNHALSTGKARLKVLSTTSQWFGVTYKEDRPFVVEKIRKLVAEGVYPENLWK